MLELGANSPFGLKAEPIAVELERHLQVVNSQCNDSDSRFRSWILLISIIRQSAKKMLV